jgi:hypothetical protein
MARIFLRKEERLVRLSVTVKISEIKSGISSVETAAASGNPSSDGRP